MLMMCEIHVGALLRNRERKNLASEGIFFLAFWRLCLMCCFLFFLPYLRPPTIFLFTYYLQSLSTSLLTLLSVCTRTLLSSRPRLQLHLSRIRHLRHPHFRLHHPIRNLRRQMGSSALNHLRRPRAPLVHGHHRLLVCDRQRTRDIRSREMGGDSGHLYFCCCVFDE